MIFFLSLLCTGFTHAQGKHALHLTIKLQSQDGRLDSLQVFVQDENGNSYHKKGQAINSFVLHYGNTYSILFTKPGTQAKKIEVNTQVPEAIAKKKSKYTLSTVLVTRTEANPSQEQKTLECKTEATVYYNQAMNAFDYKR